MHCFKVVNFLIDALIMFTSLSVGNSFVLLSRIPKENITVKCFVAFYNLRAPWKKGVSDDFTFRIQVYPKNSLL